MRFSCSVRALLVIGGFSFAIVGLAGAAATANDPWDDVFSVPLPDGHVSMPALEEPLVDGTRAGDMAKVCVSHGVIPRSFLVLGRSCEGSGQRCSVFVAVPEHDAAMLFKTYDITNPPAIVEGSAACERPEFITHGRHGVDDAE